MEDSKIAEAYEKFSRRARLYEKYAKPTRWTIPIFFVYFVASMFFMSFIRAFFQFPHLTGSSEGDVMVAFSPIILVLAINEYLSRKAKPYRMRHEEWLFLDVYPAFNNLDVYFKAKLKPDRNKATKKVREIVKKIDEKWSVGPLTLAKINVGEHVRSFKQNVEQRLLPAIEEGDEENLKRSYDFLRSFAEYLLKTKPTTDDLNELNEALLTMPTTPSEKRGFMDRFAVPIKEHSLLRHILVFMSCGIAGYFAFCLGFYVLHIAIESAYIAGLGFIGTLLIAYITYLRK